ncbi:MAG TPA: hypothetical protein VET82_08925 [Candidatus Eisenbacteria bacterium]|nr:hypothetical protein [Candidatus Eisenbacteria bacterium]
MRGLLWGLVLGLAASACVTSPNLPTTQVKQTPKPAESIGQSDWNLLDGTDLSPIQPNPVGCDTGATPVRAGVVPAVGVNPTERKLKAHQPTAVRWELVGGYSGPILLRGRQLDGPAAVYFSPLENSPTDYSSAARADGEPLKSIETSHGSMRLYAGMRLSAVGGARSWWTYVYTDRPGCFFWQQNGRDYGGLLTFQVTP